MVAYGREIFYGRGIMEAAPGTSHVSAIAMPFDGEVEEGRDGPRFVGELGPHGSLAGAMAFGCSLT